jgi:hypothetical protein
MSLVIAICSLSVLFAVLATLGPDGVAGQNRSTDDPQDNGGQNTGFMTHYSPLRIGLKTCGIGANGCP